MKIPKAPKPPAWLLAALVSRKAEVLPAVEGVEVDHPASVAEVARLLRERATDDGFVMGAYAKEYALSEATWTRLMTEIVQPVWAMESGAATGEQLQDWYAHGLRYAGNGWGAKVKQTPGYFFAQMAAQMEAETGAPPEPKPEPLRFKVRRWPTLLNLPPPSWLLPGHIHARGAGVIYGPPLSYKTFAVLDLALGLATGAGCWGFPKQDAREVLYCTGEGEYELPSLRMPPWAFDRDIEPTGNFAMVDRVPFLQDAEDLAKFVKQVHSQEFGMPKPALIVIDTLAKSMIGMDESRPVEMGLAIRRLYELSEAFNCFVLAVHHTNKAGEAYRGASNILGDLDVVIKVEAAEGIATLSWDKVKGAPQPKPRRFLARGVLNSLVLDPISEQEARERSGDLASEKTVRDALAEMGGGPVVPRALAASLCREIEDHNHQVAMIDQVVVALKEKARSSLKAYVFGNGKPLKFFLPKQGNDDTLWPL